ncbi:MAG: DUF2723 domain-containing protein [Elusimicrobiota bacterium]
MSRPLAAVLASAVFFVFFALYLWTMPPTLAPYRDAGEMGVGAHTLGVAHPPSYPLYVMAGRLADALPLGTPAYRLALVSASASAGALALLFAVVGARYGAWPAAVLVLLLGSNATYWNVAGVQEMYSLTLLLAAFLWALATRLRARFIARLWFAAAFLYGVFLGNRTDLLLWAPGLVALALPAAFRASSGAERFRFAAKTLAWTALGLSVYLYLPLRSLQGPWLDWNHPAELGNFIGSLTRRGYGGTLDLLSKNYPSGAMLLPNLKVYAGHLWGYLGLAGLALAGTGLAVSYRSDRRDFVGTTLLYGASGPLFLYLANLPPNPHAMAIVEPHYLLSDLVLAVWAARGAAALCRWRGAEGAVGYRPGAVGAVLAALCALHPLISGRFAEMDRRWNLVGYDYASNVLRSTPMGAVLVAKKDVQIFSLWYYHRVERKRSDLRLVAQGIAHSAWYRASQRRADSPLRLGLLRSGEDWRRFLEENGRPVYVTTDVAIPSGIRPGPPRGLVTPFGAQDGAKAPASGAAWEFIVRRGDYRYERRSDFFTADLVEANAVARQRLAAHLLEEDKVEAARGHLLGAWSMKRRLPETAAYLGYLYFREGALEKAADAYALADGLYDETLRLTREYHSLPDVKESVALAAADASLNLGVVHEKMGKRREAEAMYRKALVANPRYARAHYNIAVLHWSQDWPKVVRELEAALRIDPDNRDAKKYIGVARARLAGRR